MTNTSARKVYRNAYRAIRANRVNTPALLAEYRQANPTAVHNARCTWNRRNDRVKTSNLAFRLRQHAQRKALGDQFYCI